MQVKPAGAPGRARTCNLSLRRALLFPLSYGRTLRVGLVFASLWLAKMYGPGEAWGSGRRESNPRHLAWKASALPLSYARGGLNNCNT